jgi:hypothetical protein
MFDFLSISIHNIPEDMPSTMRDSLPSNITTSKSASSPRVSSPLATHSSSIDSNSDGEDNDSTDAFSSSSDDDDEEDSDSEDELGHWLARAKENARQRAVGLATADSAAAVVAGPSINLDSADLLMHEDDEE